LAFFRKRISDQTTYPFPKADVAVRAHLDTKEVVDSIGTSSTHEMSYFGEEGNYKKSIIEPVRKWERSGAGYWYFDKIVVTWLHCDVLG
jgi:hypothetical protein